MDIFGVFTLLGGLAMFLYGMSVMGSGLEKMSGGKLEQILEKLTSNTVLAVLVGTAVTAVIQSSSATTVMVVGFVNSGIMKLSQAIGIIMGANIGTTATAWILSLTGIQGDSFFIKLLKPSSFSPILALIGIILFMAAKSEKKKILGEIMLAFAILMTGMDLMSGAVEPLKDVPEFTNLLVMFKNPILGVLAGAILTAIIQSSSASVGILQALSVTGGFTFGAVIPIILGQNIGTTITAVLSSLGGNKDAKRTACVHVSFNVIGTVIFLTLYYSLNAIFHFSFADQVVDAAGIATVHSIFNVFATVILLPFVHGLEKLAYTIIPITADEKQADETFAVLDDRFLDRPSFALEQCKNLINEMGNLAKESFIEAMEVVKNPTEEGIASVIAKENRVDIYNDKIGKYLTRLKVERLSTQDNLKVNSLIHCLTDYERISDHAANVVETVKPMVGGKMVFSENASREMGIFADAVTEVLNRATEAFATENVEMARTVEPLESVIDSIDKKVKKNHLRRLNEGRCTAELGLILSDLTMSYERAADHCSNIAIYTMQLKDNAIEEHSFVEQMNEVESAEYIKLKNEFKEKYHI